VVSVCMHSRERSGAHLAQGAIRGNEGGNQWPSVAMRVALRVALSGNEGGNQGHSVAMRVALRVALSGNEGGNQGHSVAISGHASTCGHAPALRSSVIIRGHQ
jgi:hypothetical protein